MKKSERTKIKFGAIQELKTILNCNKMVLKLNWNCRYSSALTKAGYRATIKTYLTNIYSCLFSLHAAEKQIPMPLRTHAELLPFRNFNDSCCCLCVKSYFCQNCNKKILKFEGYGIKYCPHCGQKLWWPKN